MIATIEALNYRCLRYVRQDIGSFQILVGPNASGKTSFLDVVAFLGDLVSGGLDKAVDNRTHDFKDLIWGRQGERLELAIELEIPEKRRDRLAPGDFALIRYEAAVGRVDGSEELGILAEKVLLRKKRRNHRGRQRSLFPMEPVPPQTLISPKTSQGTKTVVNKVAGGNDNFYDETGKGWDHAFKLGPRKSALGNLPEDESKFPAATWLKSTLMDGVQQLVLNSVLMRKPSPPGQPKRFRADGSNLPWVVDNLIRNNPTKHKEWVTHIQDALHDVEDIQTIERPEDRHRYLVVCYRDGLVVPSWMASDGTLRLLALTLIAYLPELGGVYLIEEPENGIHPRAVESIFQSLSSVYRAQVLLATHSPVILSVAQPSQVLCFSKTESGAADIVRGTEHPMLRNWQQQETLGVLFAGGVLG